jgi:hypothetical protein
MTPPYPPMRFYSFLSNRTRHGNRAATLVVTLLVIALLSTIVVSFMQSVTLERNSSGSYFNRYQAELAAEAGLAQFLAQLGNATRTGDFSVLALTSNSSNATYTALTKFDPDSGALKIVPFASRESTSANITLSGNITMPGIYSTVDAAFPAGNKTIDLAALLKPLLEQTGGIEFASANASNLAFKCSLANMTTGANNTAEFAYVVVDECAKLNVALFGANGSATLPRNEATVEEFPSRLPVAGVGNYTVDQTDFENFKKLDPGIKSGPIWTSIYPTREERQSLNRFYSFHKGELVDFIPYGSSSSNGTWTKYEEGGKPKYDINQLATSKPDSTSNANAIADVISKNLKNFYKRDPSFENEKTKSAAVISKVPSEPTQLYNKRIAAAIVDYIDVDSNPTSVTNDALAGKELTPYVMQIAERYVWKDSSAAPPYNITIEQTVYIQLWNPYTVPVSGNLRFELETFRTFKGEPPGIADLPSEGVKPPKLSIDILVNLEPNQIRAYPSEIQEFTLTAESKKVRAGETSTGDDVSSQKHSGFKVFWNDKLYDQTAYYNDSLFLEASGLLKDDTTLEPKNDSNNPVWSSNVARNTWSGGIRRAVADPRQNQISNYTWMYYSYGNDNLRWNGASTFETSSFGTQRFKDTWLNRDSIRTLLHEGNKTPDTKTPPNLIPSTYSANEAKNAPFYIKNGNMTSIAELGHIYDPAHLDDQGANVASGTDLLSYYGFGGARTLRIGQPEFNYNSYKIEGQRSYSLLDLFSANTTESKGKRLSGINLNTAPAEVLTNFFYNMAQTADQGLSATEAGTYALSLSGAQKIAERIIDERQNTLPFFKSSDFWRFADTLTDPTNFEPNFPKISPEFPKSPSPPPDTLNVLDRGREEIFRRSYNYLETKSAAFRFYGIGRGLAKNGSVSSQVAIEALVELRASVDAAGNPFLKPVVVWKKTL